MVLFKYIDPQGKEDECYIDGNIEKNLIIVEKSVRQQGFDYVALISGIPGVGKSTLAQQLAKKLDPTFDVNRIKFTAEEIIEGTSQAADCTAWVLDESFAGLNSRATLSDLMRIISHLQLIRQKHLFIFLVLPDFFSLSKHFAIFRASHLFVVYHEEYHRGRVAVFDREQKRKLYCKGQKFVDYQCVEPNFRSKFTGKWVVDFEEYEKRKREHLISQSKVADKQINSVSSRNSLISYLHEQGKSVQEIAEIADLDVHSIYRILKK